MYKLMGLFFICLVFLTHQVTSAEVIYELSEEDYGKMPPKAKLDQFSHCLYQPGGVYCTVHADVVADGPSELLDMMKGYSAFTLFHFNHTKLRYGLCMTRNCREFYAGDSESALALAAEGCLNRSLGQEYGLKARVTEINCFFEDETKSRYKVDAVDFLAGAFFFAVFALNVVGSAYDFTRDRTKPGNKYLLSFSFRRNWGELSAPPSPDPRAQALQSLNGIRFLTSAFIVLIHSATPRTIFVENPDFIEKNYGTRLDFFLVLFGHITTQSFFLMSGLLLVYNAQLAAEREPLTLKKYFKSIFLRIMRLAPMTYVSLLLSATLSRFADHGPLWQAMTGVEVDSCRAHWIYNLLFIHNLINFADCKSETWSTSADFQLHVIGLTVVLLARTATRRRAALLLLYLVGILWPAYNIYTMDLDGTLYPRPERASEAYINDNTWHYVYKRTHSNIPVFVIGMTFGYIMYDMQKRNVDTSHYKKYRIAYWLLLPLLYLLVVSGGIMFNRAGPPAPLALRLLFLPIVRPLFGLTVALIIFGAANKVETLYRSALEWRGWVPLAKLSFGVYSLHVLVMRTIAGGDTTLEHNNMPLMIMSYLGLLGLTLPLALVLHLAVEAPFTKLVKVLLAPRVHKTEDKKE